MKKLLFSILGAFMVSTMASAQYVNVKLDDGTWRSFKTSSDMEVSFGDKKGTEPTEFEQTVTVNGHKVTVKLTDDTPASEVVFSTNIEGDAVKIKAVSVGGYGLECIKDNEVLTPDEALSPIAANGFYTFTVSDISKDMVVTIGYITVCFDLNNSKITDNFKAKPADITKMKYNSTIAPTYASAEKHSFRGWYTDKECTKAWSYSTGVTKSITLYAKWKEDPTGNKINGYEYVKLGGYYWATENLRSDGYNIVYRDSTYGDYFNQCKGKTSDFDATDNNALNAAKSLGSEGNYSWTLPSEAQWQALIDYCKWTWYTNYKGMNGYLVTGRDDTYESGHSIFLPAAGCYAGDVLVAQSTQGNYWSSANRSCLLFYGSSLLMYYVFLSDGMSVRPVAE